MIENLAIEKKVERDSNLELYRIIVMLSIIAHHYVVNSGLTECMKSDPLCTNSLFLSLFGMWGKTGINCFVMITGYFMCKSHITFRKFLKLLLQVYFYKIVITAVFLISGYSSFTFKTLKFLILPFGSVAKDFVGCFIIFYLFIPFINILIDNLSQKQHLRLLLLCLTVYTISNLLMRNVIFNYVSWFFVLYIIASYIRLYPLPIYLNKKFWLFMTISTTLMSVLSVVGILLLHKMSYYYFVADSNKILAVATAVSSFMWFKNIDIKQSKFINMLGASTFGVLLIHANSDTMRQWLWRDTLKNVEQFPKNFCYLAGHAIVSVLVIFVVCSVIDILRVKFIERDFLKKLEGKSIIIAGLKLTV